MDSALAVEADLGDISYLNAPLADAERRTPA
jgi:hypothetical protein